MSKIKETVIESTVMPAINTAAPVKVRARQVRQQTKKATKKVTKSTKSKAAKTYFVLVKEAIDNLRSISTYGKRGISQQAIKKFIQAHHATELVNVTDKRFLNGMNSALRRAVKSGNLVQIKGAGASGSFKLALVDKKSQKPKKTVATVAKPEKSVASKKKPATKESAKSKLPTETKTAKKSASVQVKEKKAKASTKKSATTKSTK